MEYFETNLKKAKFYHSDLNNITIDDHALSNKNKILRNNKQRRGV